MPANMNQKPALHGMPAHTVSTATAEISDSDNAPALLFIIGSARRASSVRRLDVNIKAAPLASKTARSALYFAAAMTAVSTSPMRFAAPMISIRAASKSAPLTRQLSSISLILQDISRTSSGQARVLAAPA